MLRITRKIGKPKEVLLKLEGHVASDWVDLLEKEIRDHIANGSRVSLDFCGVTYVDRRGVKVLRALLDEGVRTGNCSGLIDMLLGKGEQP